MKRTVSAVEARQRLGELLEGVFYRGDEVIIERAGKRMGVVIPVERYAIILQNRQHLEELIARTRAANKDVPEDEFEREVTAAIAEVRRARRRKRASGE